MNNNDDDDDNAAAADEVEEEEGVEIKKRRGRCFQNKMPAA